MLKPPIPANEPQRLAALHSLNTLYTPAEERFDRITRLASRLLDMPISLVSLVADKRQWFKSAQGLDVTETSREVSFCAHAVAADEPLVIENTLHDQRFDDNPLVTGAPNVRFYAGYPLHTSEGHCVGTLCVIDRKPRTFTPDQREILQDLAALVESELERGQMHEAQRVLILQKDELQRKAMIDGLTRLWNRAAIMDLLDAELARAQRGTPLCVAMIDADHFKRVNDTHGHQAGDAVLAELAVRLRKAARGFDAVGRYGGEEFIVVLSNCTQADARTAAERIRKSVADKPIDTSAGPLAVTVSMGIAGYDDTHTDAKSIIGAADAALYQAKANGRNRAEFAFKPG